jgi:hypothetical protein
VAFALLLALAPALASAHAKWFVDPSRHPIRFDLVLSDRTALALGAGAIAAGLLFVLQRLLRDPHWPDLDFFRRMAIGGPVLLAVQAAIGLIHAAVQPALFASNLHLERNAPGLALAALQIAIAFCFITGIADWVAAAALVLLWLASFLFFAPFDVFDQMHWLGIAVVLFLIGRFAVEGGRARHPVRALDPAWAARAIVALRVFTGLALIAAALSEKIWNPGLGEAFLREYPHFNFPRHYLGMDWFTDERFVLAAGMSEAAIGVLLISGFLTRVVILAMMVPFNFSVPFLPPQEYLGHLPIFGIMYFLLVHGAGIAPGESPDKQRPPGSPAALGPEE